MRRRATLYSLLPQIWTRNVEHLHDTRDERREERREKVGRDTMQSSDAMQASKNR